MSDSLSDCLIVSASARPHSNSAVLAREILKGAESAGARAEFVDLAPLTIHGCRGCMACAKSGVCVQKDDMQALDAKVRAARGLVLGGPIYWFNMNAQLKAFLDRCFAAAMNGGFSGKKLAAFFVYGDTDPLNSGCVNAIRSLQDVAAYTKCEWLGSVYGSAMDSGVMEREAEARAELFTRARELGVLMGEATRR